MKLQALVTASLALLTAGTLAKESCESRLETCWARGPTRPVCGTDNKTYPTRCHLLKAKCAMLQSSPNNQQPLAVNHKGQCKESKRSCWTDERRMVASGTEFGGGTVYRPKCQPDGSYAPVQCHSGIGFCWCVTPAGKPINHSYVKGKTPHCNRKGTTKGGSGQNRGRKKRKECNKVERARFVNNLVYVFKVEYGKYAKRFQEILDMKFDSLDLDKNGTLTVEEYRVLRRKLKYTVRPKKCARVWVRVCDKNKDKIIDREEWHQCIAITSDKKPGEEKNKLDGIFQGGFPGTFPIISRKRLKEESSESEDEPEVYDCLTDRKSVLEEHTLGNADMYMPECTPDGRYQKIQCFKSIGYCWCVYEDTGKPIPGTSIKDNKPNCDVVHTTPRMMKDMTSSANRWRFEFGPREILKEYD